MEQGLESSIAQSLLSLSKSSNAIPIMVPSAKSQQEPADSLLFADGSGGDGSLGGTSGFPAGLPGSIGAGSLGNPSTLKHHRRLSSTGKTKRRLSDARDAASRPSPASLSLSGLSLNSPPHANVPLSTSFTSAMGTSSPVNISGQAPDGLPGSLGSVSSSIPGPLGNGLPASVDNYKTILPGAVVGSAPAGTIVKPVPIAKNGKKRGMDHRCEMCNKVYRHPSCLIKHRWEHTTHWRESSKYVLSKHQQVQLLEAAAILSHFSSDSATGTSLPEDRSLWPSFLSGGALPLPEGSCSVPALTSSTRATSTGPRLHDYAISTADAVKVRPGLVVANGNAAGGEQTTNVTVKGSTPIPVPNGTEVYGYGYGYGRAGSASGNSVSRGKSWGDRSSSPYNTRSSGAAAASASISLPRSSLRSGSSSSASGSGSGGRSGSSELEDEEEVEDQEEEDDDVDVDVVDVDGGIAGKMRYPYEYDTGVKAGMKPMKEEEEDWEMEMDMD